MAVVPAEINVCPSFGWQVELAFNTKVWSLRNGMETRDARASAVRHRFILPFRNIRDQSYLNYIKAAFLSVRGMKDAFLVKDETDYVADDVSLGNAPAGSDPVQLTIPITFGTASYTRIISKPLLDGFELRQSGVVKAGTLDTQTGIFTPDSAWTEGEPLTADFEFRVPVRFASDALPMTIDSRMGQDFAMNGAVELIEVFGE